MRVYLSVPMIANRELGRAKLMADAVREAGHQVSSPWVLGKVENPNPADLNLFDRDKRGAEDCDLLLADVSMPSIGVGMEIMAAHKAGRRVLVVAKRGSVVSRMLLHMRDKDMIEFDGDADLKASILSALQRG